MWDLPHRKPAQPRSRIETVFEIMAVDRVMRCRGFTCNRDQLASYDPVAAELDAGEAHSVRWVIDDSASCPRVIVDGF